ncbi:hypothetical protein SI65_02337 [Aspergillus cristatus]|uniref:C3H1-type domain-containing protein n=1 Tax=Aspergillus cristatus TaxID=573508 RepID=A0A1E3BKH7_ASPCR|nr:hypothetical protein SI65_02337 [Aspergillus cristatus]
MTEDQDLLSKISQLAGQINRHKNQSTQGQNDSAPTPYATRHDTSRWAPYRGRHYAPRGRPAPHRHRTLVLNNTAGPGQSSGSTPASTPGAPATENNEAPASTSNGWVAKRDRHMQLINSAVYDKEAQARAKAMEDTRKAKAQKKTQVEQAKVLSYAQGVGRQFPPPTVAAAPAAAAHPAGYQLFFNDIPFRIARGGSKLIRMSNDPNNTPKRVSVAGVTFVRSKNGNLHRLGAVTSKRNPTVKKKNELCKRFTTTGTCYKGPSCFYIHDPNKVAICKEFLHGKCSAGIDCDLSHQPSPHRSPTCLHFLRGRCANPECPYAHVRVTPGAPVCRNFATLGYCEKGADCEERHVNECPDYANTGVCNRKHCRLPHVDRAGQMKNTAIRAEGPRDDESDASSEEEEYDEIDSDDVDSDDEDPEFIEGVDTGELSQQQDFVHF